jgi:hypothetical protein
MRADEKDGGNIVRRKCEHHPKRSGQMRYADLGQKIVTRQPVVKGCATACTQRREELVIRTPFLLAQLVNLLSGSFCCQRACRHGHRLPTLTAFFAFLVGSERWAHIACIHLRQAFRQIRSIEQSLILQLIPQNVAKVPILASRAQVDEEAKDCMQTLRVQKQARPHRPGREKAIFRPCADRLIAHQQNPSRDGNPDRLGRRERTAGRMNQARGLLRAFAFDGVGDIEHVVHPCEQAPNRRFLAFHDRGCHASDYAPKIGSMVVLAPSAWPFQMRAGPWRDQQA